MTCTISTGMAAVCAHLWVEKQDQHGQRSFGAIWSVVIVSLITILLTAIMFAYEEAKNKRLNQEGPLSMNRHMPRREKLAYLGERERERENMEKSLPEMTSLKL